MDVGLLVVVLVGPLLMVLIAGIARAAAAGRVRPNHLVGIRLRSTLASDAAWRAGHRAAVMPAICSAVLLALADVVAVLLTEHGDPDDLLTPGLSVLLVLAVVVVAIVADRAARRRDEAGE